MKIPKYLYAIVRAFCQKLRDPVCCLYLNTYPKTIQSSSSVPTIVDMPFQGVVAVEGNSNEDLEYRERFARHDTRDSFGVFIFSEIPDDSSLIVYGAEAAKKAMRQVLSLYPREEARLEKIFDNMLDLEPLFKNRQYCQQELQGDYSLKSVATALFPYDAELDYRSLGRVKNDLEAADAVAVISEFEKQVVGYRRTFFSNYLSAEREIEGIMEESLAYCRLNALAMVKIIKMLRNI